MTVRIFSSSVLSAREDKIRIPKQPCNVLFIMWISMKHPNLRNLSFVFISKENSGYLYRGGVCNRKYTGKLIHLMQIWRTTRSAPGTSLMKAMFCFDNVSPEKLASSSTWSVLFRCGYELLCFWTPRKRILIFHRSPLRENSGSMQFVEKKERSSRSPRELFKLSTSNFCCCNFNGKVVPMGFIS